MSTRLSNLLLAMLFSVGVALVEPTFTSNAAGVAEWIAQQQYLNPDQPSYGGLKIGSGPAVTVAGRTPYYRVSPYPANLAVLGLLGARAPQSQRVARLWISWYFAHLNSRSAPDGVPYEHFYLADGAGETTCVKSGDQSLCHYNDATDSAAATFFSVLGAACRAGYPASELDTPERQQRIHALASVLRKLQQSDGLCWAKGDYRVKYLEDNCEVFAGLSDLSDLERKVFRAPDLAAIYRQAADRVQQGILSQLYDPRTKLFLTAKFENGRCPPANLDRWYPDSQAQSWPLLFGVLTPLDPRALAARSAINAHWNGRLKPGWTAQPAEINNGSIEAANAYAALLAGETNRVQTYLRALNLSGSKKFDWPFNIADADWLLQILERANENGTVNPN